jgi:hypothetical protein
MTTSSLQSWSNEASFSNFFIAEIIHRRTKPSSFSRTRDFLTFHTAPGQLGIYVPMVRSPEVGAASFNPLEADEQGAAFRIDECRKPQRGSPTWDSLYVELMR